MTFERPLLKKLVQRLSEDRNRIHILSGARQVGKTTLSIQALQKIEQPHRYVITESGFTTTWLEQQWAIGRALAKQHNGAVLVIDEIQKIDQWSERVKRLWDEDTANQIQLKIVLLGSSALLLQRGLTESVAGRYEILNVPHWSFSECQEAFGITLDEFLYFGAYPGALVYQKDEERFLSYMQDSIIEPVVTRDILSQHIIRKPALLRNLFLLGTEYSGQILSFNKILGQMQDAGNTTTLAHYLTLLDQADVLKGIEKFANEPLRVRQSSPKFQTYNTALATCVSKLGFQNTMSNPELRGRLIESAVGATLLMDTQSEIFYWRENNKEVDFVVRAKGKLIAIEVKSGKKISHLSGMELFRQKFAPDVMLLVGTGGIPLDVFLKSRITDFI